MKIEVVRYYVEEISKHMLVRGEIRPLPLELGRLPGGAQP